MVEKSSQAMDAPVMPAPMARRVYTLRRIFCLLVVVLVFAGDQITKDIVQRAIPHDVTIPVIPGFFNLIHTENTGIAFSLFAGASSSWKLGLIIGVSAALLITVIVVALKSRGMNWKAGVGLALIMGGASSNLLDRIRFGQVVDFLDFYFRSYHWATFNLADSAIVVGAGLLLLEILLSK
ncbi:MAG: signal peptidase II [Acidobacteria bacterium]|nr:MAG: signal peptidase II [Acidobacteriota bacterium]